MDFDCWGKSICWIDSSGRGANGSVGARLKAIVDSWIVPRDGMVFFADFPTLPGSIVIVRVGIKFPDPSYRRLPFLYPPLLQIEHRVAWAEVRDAPPTALESSLHATLSREAERFWQEGMPIDR